MNDDKIREAWRIGELVEAGSEIGRLRDEVRMFQAWMEKLDELRGGEGLSCEEICLVVCAGPCEGRPMGPLNPEHGK